MIGQSRAFLQLLKHAERAAKTNASVLIIGETGTGKELLMDSIWRRSSRSERRLVSINSAALPEGLVESELFGHLRGAFTGAIHDQVGKLEMADGGTVFLDEIDSLPLITQAKLLRFLESGEIQPVGARTGKQLDVRVIAASNANLKTMVSTGAFRSDLYYRLDVVRLVIPPLRDRVEDIPLMLAHFLGDYAARHGTRPVRLEPGAEQALCAYGWPGNVRQLRNLCERISILYGGRTIEARQLPPEVHQKPSTRHHQIRLPDSGVNLELLEIELIQQAIEKAQNNKTLAASYLGISRDKLLYRMRKHGLR